jgi:pimeloyl-ACP methyl ester carboxylesterase
MLTRLHAKSTRLVLLFGVVGALAIMRAAWHFVCGYRSEGYALSPPVGPVPLPTDAPMLGLQPIVVANGGERIGAWYARPQGGGTVVLCTGTSATRASLLVEARSLIAGGHGVVLFDWPGHGESTGAVEWGDPARRALRAVLLATSQLPGVDSTRIGVFAFSFGGGAAVPEVAHTPSVRALVVVATPLDPWEQLRYEHAGSGWFAVEGARLFWRRRGDDLMRLRIAPEAIGLGARPVLVITGVDDHTVDPADAARLVEIIGPSAQLWRIQGAGHGGYASVTPEYGPRLAAFFTRTLAPPHDASNVP